MLRPARMPATEGEPVTQSDVAYLIAAILFAVVFVMNLLERAVVAALLAAGLTAVAVGLLIT
jgi:hypothetical protein